MPASSIVASPLMTILCAVESTPSAISIFVSPLIYRMPFSASKEYVLSSPVIRKSHPVIDCGPALFKVGAPRSGITSVSSGSVFVSAVPGSSSIVSGFSSPSWISFSVSSGIVSSANAVIPVRWKIIPAARSPFIILAFVLFISACSFYILPVQISCDT